MGVKWRREVWVWAGGGVSWRVPLTLPEVWDPFGAVE